MHYIIKQLISGNKIYIIGSHTVVANLYVYDIEADTWEECESIGPNVQKLAILDDGIYRIDTNTSCHI
jgi:hypothetical protein